MRKREGEIVVSAYMYSAFNTQNNKVRVRLTGPLRFRLRLSLFFMQVAAWLAYAEYTEDGEWTSNVSKNHIGIITRIEKGVAYDEYDQPVAVVGNSLTWTRRTRVEA